MSGGSDAPAAASAIEDHPRTVRSAEALDGVALGAYVQRELGGSDVVSVEQFPGGHSNLTYLVRHGAGEYVLRRPPFGSKVKTAHDMGREVAVLSKLAPVWPLAPKVLAYCADESVLGAPFYLMERRRGVILRKEVPSGLTIDPAAASRLCELLVDALAALHGIDYVAAGLGDFGKPAGYVERQVRGWTERYAGSQTDEIATVSSVATWLEAHRPADSSPRLIHNDFKFDNLIFDRSLTKITGILDWEMSTVGDPLMDLGTSLGYWVQPDDPPALQLIRFGLTTIPGMWTRDEVAKRYLQATGRTTTPSSLVFYYAFGLFKTAVVAQQIYYRYAKGLTKDPRFAAFLHGVRALSAQAQLAIDRGRL
jgi:aminoglycoside phosphotransferase (APT) family kinase protein